jgi:hypothetical protein
VEQTVGQELWDWTGIKVRKIPGTKTRGLYGHIVNRGRIDNTFKFLCKLHVKQGGEYRLMPFKLMPQSICDAANNEKHFIPDFVKVSNFTQPIECPLPEVLFRLFFITLVQLLFCQVAYEVHGYQAKLPEALAMAVQTGEYSGELIIIDKDGEVVFSVMAYVAVVKV